MNNYVTIDSDDKISVRLKMCNSYVEPNSGYYVNKYASLKEGIETHLLILENDLMDIEDEIKALKKKKEELKKRIKKFNDLKSMYDHNGCYMVRKK